LYATKYRTQVTGQIRLFISEAFYDLKSEYGRQNGLTDSVVNPFVYVT